MQKSEHTKEHLFYLLESLILVSINMSNRRHSINHSFSTLPLGTEIDGPPSFP